MAQIRVRVKYRVQDWKTLIKPGIYTLEKPEADKYLKFPYTSIIEDIKEVKEEAKDTKKKNETKTWNDWKWNKKTKEVKEEIEEIEDLEEV